MRRLLLITTAALLAAVPAAAAEGNEPPTTNELAMARGVALSYWHGPPSCGMPSIAVEPLKQGRLGQATYRQCAVQLSASYDWSALPILLCEVIVHETGHLVLGPTYFAAVNPSEPEHSPDATNIMANYLPETFAPCEPLLQLKHENIVNETENEPRAKMPVIEGPREPYVKVRLPASLHAELVRRAHEQGVSLNHLMVALLAGAIKFSLKKGA